MENIIQFDHLTKSYGKHRGIVDLDFTIKEQEIFGFIGPNGAGKSTTIRTLLGLLKPNSGHVSVLGMDAHRQRAEIADHIGYLPSEVFYYPQMRVIDVLEYAASFYKKDCSARIAELSQLLELDLHRRVEDLSLGNKKKVGIVQGLLHSPDIIILDEPTSGLDPLMQQRFFDLLEAENHRGATVLFSSHILSEVQRLCKRIAIIKDGRLVSLQSMDQLSTENYKRIRVVSTLPPTFDSLAGLRDLKTFDHVTTFIFKGNINELIAALSQQELLDLSVEEPSLDEIFMHYYQ